MAQRRVERSLSVGLFELLRLIRVLLSVERETKEFERVERGR